jgi:HlyD family type I secretion membrane fusion protein
MISASTLPAGRTVGPAEPSDAGKAHQARGGQVMAQDSASVSADAKPSATQPSYPVSMRASVRVGWLIALAAFGGLTIWSAVAPLATAVIAPGTVAVEGSRQSVQHLQGGIVDAILVRDGDRVAAGQVVMRLDATEVRASVQLLQGRLDEARATEARLIGERDRLPTITFPADFHHAAPRTAALRSGMLPETMIPQDVHDDALRAAALRDIMLGQRKLFEARREALDGQAQIHQAQIQQLHLRLEGLQRQGESSQRQLELLETDLEGLETLLLNDNVAATRVRQVMREREQILAQEASIAASIGEVYQRIGEVQLQITQLEKAFLQEVESKLQEVRAEIFDLTERLGAARMQMARLKIAAPASGSVVGLSVHTPGGVVAAGETLMEIVPDTRDLIIEAQIQPNDVDAVAVGMPADIRFPAYSARSAPVLQGKVETVSADRLVDPVSRMPYFLVRVRVDEDQASELTDSGMRLVPGMPADVMVMSGQKSLFDYIIQPIRESMARAMIE